MSDKLMPQIDVQRISRDPLEEVEVGKWYWVKDEDREWNKKTEEYITVEKEFLMCVDKIGSNYVGFTVNIHHGTNGIRIHFDEFATKCRPELKWKEYLQGEMARLQLAIQEKTRELIDAGKSLYLLPQDVSPEQPKENDSSLLPVKMADDPKKYKKQLIKLKDKTLPDISKEIEELAKDYAVVAKNTALPDMCRLGMVKEKLGVVEDKIFTIELYCGLQEEVEQIADGEPAPMMEKVAIRQQMLYMDEETLFDYKDGGMDFKKIRDFDKWIVQPEQLNRVLPEKKGIVAFRVRRDAKEYPEARSIGEVLAHISWHEANMKTYILIRNGERVYRIASSINFSPRLIPKRGEIGEEQFKQIDRRWVCVENSETKDNPFGERQELITETIVTPESVKYDDHVEKLDEILKQYNRIVILIQGLLDRSKVFHPHPPINLTKVGQIDEWVRLIRDEEDGLPCNKVTWEEYRKQLNTTLKVGKWVFIRYPKIYNGKKYDRRARYYDEEAHQEVRLPHRGWNDNRMPDVCKIEKMRRDGSKVLVSWPKGSLNKPRQGAWIPDPKKPGWGHYEHIWESDRILHEWVPTKYTFNLSDYMPGDYKMFLCDHALKGKYLQWAPSLLTAEGWSQRRAGGQAAEEDKLAQVRG